MDYDAQEKEHAFQRGNGNLANYQLEVQSSDPLVDFSLVDRLDIARPDKYSKIDHLDGSWVYTLCWSWHMCFRELAATIRMRRKTVFHVESAVTVSRSHCEMSFELIFSHVFFLAKVCNLILHGRLLAIL